MSNIRWFERPEAVARGPTGDQVVGLLDSLLDAMVIARPGRDAAGLAAAIRRRGDSAAYFAGRIDALSASPAIAPMPETLAPPKRRHAIGA